MLTITRGEKLPDESLCNVWVGDICTVYMPGDEEALEKFRASLPPPEPEEQV